MSTQPATAEPAAHVFATKRQSREVLGALFVAGRIGPHKRYRSHRGYRALIWENGAFRLFTAADMATCSVAMS